MPFKRRPPKGSVRNTRSTGKNVHGTKTNKNGRTVAFESREYEQTFTWLLDRDPDIQDWWSQSLVIIFIDENGKERTYTPDFKSIDWDGEVTIYEITRDDWEKFPDLVRRHKAGLDYCKGKGWIFKIIKYSELPPPKSTWTTNLDDLYGFRAKCCKNQFVEDIANKMLKQNQKMKLFELVSKTCSISGLSEPVVRTALFHGLWNCTYDFDIKEKLLMIDCEICHDVDIWIR